MRTAMVLALALLSTAAARADVIHLTNGGTLDGVILSESKEAVTVRLKYGSARIPREEIASIDKAAASDDAAQGPMPRLADWRRALAELARRDWGKAFRQIPATVVDKGVLAMVPYMSHAAGEHEFNIYGDPDSPSCLEIGVRGSLLGSDAAKKECVDFMTTLLAEAKDQAFLHALALAKDKQVKDGLTFEVTPETAEDAYGGWWISIYDEALVARQRATEEEMKDIAVSREALKKEEEARKAEERAAAEERKKAEAEARAAEAEAKTAEAQEKRAEAEARNAEAQARRAEAQARSARAYDPYLWRTLDLSYSRARFPGGRYDGYVYVRGYGRGTGGYAPVRNAGGRR